MRSDTETDGVPTFICDDHTPLAQTKSRASTVGCCPPPPPVVQRPRSWRRARVLDAVAPIHELEVRIRR